MPLTNDLVERLAMAIHDRYRRNQADRKPADDPAMKPWALLGESLKQSCRDQALAIPEQLKPLGYRLVQGSGSGPVTLTADQVERLAILEHERWVRDRTANGWTSGPRDVLRRTTPYLVAWEELDEAAKEWDREAVRAIPDLVAEAGLGVIRL